MEIAVRTTEFARVLRLVQSLADRKNTVPVWLGAHPCRCKRFNDHRNRRGTGRDFLLSSGYTSHWFACRPGAAVIRLRSYASRRRTGSKGTK